MDKCLRPASTICLWLNNKHWVKFWAQHHKEFIEEAFPYNIYSFHLSLIESVKNESLKKKPSPKFLNLRTKKISWKNSIKFLIFIFWILLQSERSERNALFKASGASLENRSNQLSSSTAFQQRWPFENPSTNTRDLSLPK